MEKIFIVFCETPGEIKYIEDNLIIPIGEGDSKTIQITNAEVIERFKKGVLSD